MEKYDIAVLGGGPGGYVAAIKAAQAGKKVCLFEQDNPGGVCLNRGCIPTKALLKSVEVLEYIKKADEYGISGLDIAKAAFDLAKMQHRKRMVVSRLTGGVKSLLSSNGIKIIQAAGTFVDKNVLSFGKDYITADNIIIATGSTPVMPAIPMSGEPRVITSDEALELLELPKRIAIIGGGVIGIEFAYLFRKLGAHIEVFELMDSILPMVDEEIAGEVTRMLEGIGVKIHTGCKVTRFEGTKVFFSKNGQESYIHSDVNLMAVGRIPNTSGLMLEAAGVKTEKNAIVTDEFLRTNVPGIYAIGDVNGKMMLAHTASMEGLVAIENICGVPLRMNYKAIPQCIYLQPEIAAVGLTEKQAIEKYGRVKVGRFPLAANGKALVEGETRGMIKVIIEPEFKEILGVHIYGLHATEMIGEAVTAINSELTAENVSLAVHPHPTVSEIIGEAFHSALGKAIHF